MEPATSRGFNSEALSKETSNPLCTVSLLDNWEHDFETYKPNEILLSTIIFDFFTLAHTAFFLVNYSQTTFISLFFAQQVTVSQHIR